MSATHPLPPAITLMGPTAAGKTGIAIELVEQFPLEIISVDSALIYRGMDIGTAKPDAGELARAPHRLIDILDPSESWSAAAFREAALGHMAEISASGRVPLLVGGTMLYFRALLEGLSPLPAADPKVREKLEAQANKMGWGAMHERLAQVDPDAARRIHPNDPQRIQRALEVFEISGKSLSELQQSDGGDPLPFRVLKIVVAPSQRAVLHQRIEQRLNLMVQAGFLDEVRKLHQRGDLHAGLPSIRSVGYRQAWAHLEGEYSEAEMVQKAIEATRQLAKRQLTWLRREPHGLCYDLDEFGAQKSITERVRSFLETNA